MLILTIGFDIIAKDVTRFFPGRQKKFKWVPEKILVFIPKTVQSKINDEYKKKFIKFPQTVLLFFLNSVIIFDKTRYNYWFLHFYPEVPDWLENLNELFFSMHYG